MKKEELKPCPFCGGKAEMFEFRDSRESLTRPKSAQGLPTHIRLSCISCGLGCPTHVNFYMKRHVTESKRDMVRAWNRRAK